MINVWGNCLSLTTALKTVFHTWAKLILPMFNSVLEEFLDDSVSLDDTIKNMLIVITRIICVCVYIYTYIRRITSGNTILCSSQPSTSMVHIEYLDTDIFFIATHIHTQESFENTIKEINS